MTGSDNSPLFLGSRGEYDIDDFDGNGVRRCSNLRARADWFMCDVDPPIRRGARVITSVAIRPRFRAEQFPPGVDEIVYVDVALFISEADGLQADSWGQVSRSPDLLPPTNTEAWSRHLAMIQNASRLTNGFTSPTGLPRDVRILMHNLRSSNQDGTLTPVEVEALEAIRGWKW